MDSYKLALDLFNIVGALILIVCGLIIYERFPFFSMRNTQTKNIDGIKTRLEREHKISIVRTQN